MKPKENRDELWMHRALLLARRGEGLTRPNPPVGAVLVKNGRLIGEGYHRKAGGPHAEIYALRHAGEKARGATLYVTLEPCSTWGKTPPCTDAILKARVNRVVVAVTDPNPRHRGRGLRILRKHGVRVRCGVCREEAEALCEPFAKWITTGRPWVTLKLACTLDGKIADAKGQSKWITGLESRRLVQAWRRRVDAVMVGAATVAADDPQLMPRPDRGRKPFRIVVDSARGVAPLNARVFTDNYRHRTLLAIPQGYSTKRRRVLESRGVKILEVSGTNGRVALRHLMSELGKLGFLHVLCEGGGKLAGSLVKLGLVDAFLLFYAPILLGNGDSHSMLDDVRWLLHRAAKVDIVGAGPMGKDWVVQAKPRRA